ncbi:MAG: hypothetical protein BAA04_11290 [Firmicutes bacterium ZCTH02-B6]|nr:MAG: hypothetical protein BAA04_11290 [Firmicutes bacterium ZCTH02-B6]
MTAAALAAFVLLWPLPVLQVTVWDEGSFQDGGGAERTVRIPLVPGETFGIRYRHSIFEVPVEERLALARQRFVLVEVWSTTNRIEGYYAFPQGRLEEMPGYFRLLPGVPVMMETPLRVRATAAGRRTLVVGTRCVPLVSLGPVVELNWRWEPLVLWLWAAAHQTILGKEVQLPCPVPAITTTPVPPVPPAA